MAKILMKSESNCPVDVFSTLNTLKTNAQNVSLNKNSANEAWPIFNLFLITSIINSVQHHQ